MYVIEIKVGTGESAEWRRLRPSDSVVPYRYEKYRQAADTIDMCYPRSSHDKVRVAFEHATYVCNECGVGLDPARSLHCICGGKGVLKDERHGE